MTHAVIIPLYNKAAYITATLESLMRQTKLPDELIIVDDASTDGSLQTATEFLQKNQQAFAGCSLQVVNLKENSGPGNARNIGLEMARAELVSFLDADDLYHPLLLETVARVFNDAQLDFLVLNMEFIPGGEIYPNLEALKKYLQPVNENLYRILTPLKAVTSPHFIMGVGSNVVARRSWMQSTRYITHSFLNEGIDFWYRVLKQIVNNSSGKIALLTGCYLQVREVPGSLSRKTYSHFSEVEMPHVITRYRNSRDVHDRLLMGMIGCRWYAHALQSLHPFKQKALFVLYYSYLLPQYLGYVLLRRFY